VAAVPRRTTPRTIEIQNADVFANGELDSTRGSDDEDDAENGPDDPIDRACVVHEDLQSVIAMYIRIF
jgi:hypothetical protein